VAKHCRRRPLDSVYEHFCLVEVRYSGLPPLLQRGIEGELAHDGQARATLRVTPLEEFKRKYAGKRLMAVVHVTDGERGEYFVEELGVRKGSRGVAGLCTGSS